MLVGLVALWHKHKPQHTWLDDVAPTARVSQEDVKVAVLQTVLTVDAPANCEVPFPCCPWHAHAQPQPAAALRGSDMTSERRISSTPAHRVAERTRKRRPKAALLVSLRINQQLADVD